MDREPEFSCGSCGKSYKWKPQFAGKKAKCSCGAALTVPQQMPDSEPPQIEQANADALDDPDRAVCPKCGAELASGAVLCVQCGFNLNTGRKAGVVVGATGGEEEEDAGAADQLSVADRRYLLKQREIPLALLALGVGLHLFWAWRKTRGEDYFGEGFGAEAGEILKEVAIGVGLMIAAAFAAARLLETSFGSLGPAVLKFAAIYVAPAAVSTFAGSLVGEWSWVVSIPLLLGMYYGLLVWLFDLDVFEAFVFASIGYLINAWILNFLLGGVAF
ncbi:MAG: zinc ribbon domain-containing protein [Phycisphaerae bacterium]|nr:zinc ribbon domain-containing protein [Phycisphaerae bacterium]